NTLILKTIDKYYKKNTISFETFDNGILNPHNRLLYEDFTCEDDYADLLSFEVATRAILSGYLIDISRKNQTQLDSRAEFEDMVMRLSKKQFGRYRPEEKEEWKKYIETVLPGQKLTIREITIQMIRERLPAPEFFTVYYDRKTKE